MTNKHLFLRGRAKEIWLIMFLLITSFTGLVHAQADEDCLMCHEDRELTGMLNGRNISMFVDTSIFAHSVHHSNTCLSCHADAADEGFPHADDLKPVNCGTCHTQELANNVRGAHGQSLLRNDPNAPSCKECHGHHDVLHNSNTESRTYKMNIPYLCVRCHKEGEVVARVYDVSEHNIVENYTQGIHGRGLILHNIMLGDIINPGHYFTFLVASAAQVGNIHFVGTRFCIAVMEDIMVTVTLFTAGCMWIIS